jgi:hypothetical protein
MVIPAGTICAFLHYVVGFARRVPRWGALLQQAFWQLGVFSDAAARHL